ncbi:uncharacterized protein RSE6_06130 [Rhynchosporium secalis]|uniref:Uncharacterized protein n=1 Tax=Rhynchosporium secalis TaxID=38038 RepID=A0A1E1M9K3_RHYSE|nr:uncharacterized protein RSE6_06130 [Rhynchosporium secalis]
MASPPPNNNPPSRTNSGHFSSNFPARITDMAQSSGVTRVRNDESWVEIASQPSSSSLSSINDEIVTTGLRVQHNDPNTRRRRRAPGQPSYISLETRQTSTSSQEEYEESESESDRVMTSSNEHILPTTSHRQFDAEGGESSSDDDDENSTALGRRTSTGGDVFTPQPNAFSHPPSRAGAGPGVHGSYFPSHYQSTTNRNINTRQSYPPRVSRQNSGYNNALDHDAALRASLNTLLSIGAAAARGLPKRNQVGTNNTMTGHEPIGLRFVPESELMAPPPQNAAANTSRPLSPSTRARSSPSVSSQEAIEKGKRKAVATKPAGEKSRALKKKRMQQGSEEERLGLRSPTLLTWVMSAGVVVLVSVVGFGAGYVIGREVGRGEVMTGLNGSSLAGGGDCGKEVARSSGSLRRFRWGVGGGRGVVA